MKSVPPISVLMKPSSGMCNMHCDYCFYCDEVGKRKQANYGFMSEETLHNVLRRTLPHAQGTAGFVFQGGEPTLRGLDFFRKVIEYERRCNSNRVSIQNSLQTNGALIDEDWCRFLHDEHFLVGISVDGLPAIHDSHRRLSGSTESSYDRVCRAAGLMDRFQVDYNILTVVHADVASHIEDIYRSYKKRGWKYQQYIACLDPLGEGHGNKSYALTPELYGDFLIRLFNLWYRDALEGRQPYIRQFENYLGILLGYSPESCDQRGVCSIQYVVEADGSVYPCDFYMLDEYRLGNFNTDRLPVIDEKRKEIGFIEQSCKLDEGCRSCPYYRLCRGGCRRSRDPAPESEMYRNYFCKSYRMFFDACLPRMEKIIGRH